MNFAAIQRWLELELDADAAILRGAVVWHGEGVRAAGVIASCPAKEHAAESLTAVALAAFEQATTVQHEIAGLCPGAAPTVVIGQPVFIAQMGVGAVAWEVPAGDEASDRNWVDALGRACTRLAAWLQPESDAAQASAALNAIDAGALVLALTGEVVKAASAEEAARRVAAVLVAERVAQSASIGLCEGRAGSRIRLIAISDAATIDDGSPLVLALHAAMDECAHQQRSIVYPPARASQPVIDLAHSQLARQPGAMSVCSVPMASDGAIVGVLTLQRASGAAPSDAELSMLEHVAAFVGPALALQRRAESGFAAKLKGSVARHSSGNKALKKWWPAAAALAAAGACLLPAQHQIAAPARLQGSHERALVAPHDGYIAKALVKPGDRVAAGQVLAEFELEGVQLERRRLEAELSQAENAFGEALGKRDRAQLAIQQARIEQARSRLELVVRDIDKARVTAPFAGVVLNGDLSRSVGSPVKRGELLMTLAPEEGFRLMLWVDERDVGYVTLDQPGRLLLAASPHNALALKVSRVTPVAVAREAANGFEVEASVQGAAAGLRPGLEGIAKLNAGTRPLAWVIGHRFAHWLSLKWWAWLG